MILRKGMTESALMAENKFEQITAAAPSATARADVRSINGVDAGEQCLPEGKAQWERLPQTMRGMMDKATWDLAWQLAWCAAMKASTVRISDGAD